MKAQIFCLFFIGCSVSVPGLAANFSPVPNNSSSGPACTRGSCSSTEADGVPDIKPADGADMITALCLSDGGCTDSVSETCKKILKCKGDIGNDKGDVSPESSAVPLARARPPDTSTAAKSPSSTAPASTSGATQEQCDHAAQDAGNCCNRPETCGGGQVSTPVQSPNQSMQEYCNQMNAASSANTQANNRAGQACTQKIETCKNTCNSAGDNSTAQGCSSLTAKVVNMGRQSLAGLNSSGSAQQCQSLSQAQPQSGGGPGGMPNMPNQNQNENSNSASNNPNDPTGCQTNPTGAQCQKCTANPNDPSCGSQQMRGQSAFSEAAERLNKNSFDVPDVPSASRSMFDMASANTQSQPAKNGTVPNNTGGGVGGAGGGGGGAASLGGGNQRKGGGGGSGISTDILQGNMPGGYTNAPGGNAETDGGGGWGGYGGRMPASADGRGMDLKQFLPGQKNAPAFVGGAYSMRSAEIAGKHGDIFEKITRKFHEKCLKGQLIGCDR